MDYKKTQTKLEKEGVMMVRMLLAILASSILIGCTMFCETNKSAIDDNALRRLKLDEQLKVIRTEKDPALVKEIEDILNIIENTKFVWNKDLLKGRIEPSVYKALMIADEPGLGRVYLLALNDIKFLIKNADISLPLIYELMANMEWKWTEPRLSGDTKLCAYFTVFAETKNPDSLPYLIDYLRKVPPERRESAFNPTEPFWYAADAVLAFTGPTKEIPFSLVFDGPEYGIGVEYCRMYTPWNSAFDNRLKLADDAQKWYDNYKNNGR